MFLWNWLKEAPLRVRRFYHEFWHFDHTVDDDDLRRKVPGVLRPVYFLFYCLAFVLIAPFLLIRLIVWWGLFNIIEALTRAWDSLTHKLWRRSASRGLWSMPSPADRPRITPDNAQRITNVGKLRLWGGWGPYLSFGFAFSPDSTILAVGGGDKTVTLWEVATGRLLSLLKGRELERRPFPDIEGPPSVRYVAFSPDGKTLVVRSEDDTVTVWEVGRGRELYMLTGLASIWLTGYGPVYPHVSPGGKILTAVSEHPVRVTVWDLATGQELLSLGRGLHQFAFSPDGKLLATAGLSLMRRTNVQLWDLQLWEVETERKLRVLSTSSDRMIHLTFSPDGAILAAATPEGTVQVWNVATGQERYSLSAHTLDCMAFSPDGKILAVATRGTADSPGPLRLWEVATGRELNSLAGGDRAAVNSISFSPDGLILGRGRGESLQLWEVATGQELYTLAFRDKEGRIGDIAFSPDGTLLAVEEDITKGSGVAVYAVR